MAVSWEANHECKVMWHFFEKEKPTENGLYLVITNNDKYYLLNWYKENDVIQIIKDAELADILVVSGSEVRICATEDGFYFEKCKIDKARMENRPVLWMKLDDPQKLYEKFSVTR